MERKTSEPLQGALACARTGVANLGMRVSGERRATEAFKVPADPTRLEIVRRLARAEPAELSCGDFGCATKQLAAYHLRTLREAGVTLRAALSRNVSRDF